MNRAAHHFGRSAAVVLGLVIAASAAFTSAPTIRSAHAMSFSSLSHFDAHLLAHINRVRANHGLVKVRAAAGTTDVAHRWSCGMASRRAVSHNMDLSHDLETHGSKNWTSYAENVAVQPAGRSPGKLFRSYMNSPTHRANILDPSARFVGLWSKRSGSFRFNTIDFVGSGSWAYNTTYGGMKLGC